MFCGVWPVWKKPLTEYKLLNSLSITYSVVIMACFTYNMVLATAFYQHLYGKIGTGYLLSMVVLMTCDTVVKVTIVHLSVRGYDNLLKKVKDLPMYNGKNRKIQGYLLIVMILLEVCIGKYTYDTIYGYVQNFPSELESNKVYTLSKTKTEAYIYLIVNTMLSTLEMIYIPAIVILGLSITVCDLFSKLKVELIKAFDTCEIYNPELNKLSKIRRTYLRLCEIVACIDKTFRVYIVSCSVFLGSSLLNNVYYFSAGCLELKTYVINLSYNIGAFLILCVSGALVNNAVSEILWQQESIAVGCVPFACQSYVLQQPTDVNIRGVFK